MLFNSYEFLLLFLPLTVGLYAIAERWAGPKAAMSWLVAASLFFYGWWNPAYVPLIGLSILFNYQIGSRLVRSAGDGTGRPLLTVGVTGNLVLLGYFKYANFFVDNINFTLGTTYHLETIILPLAISFFTFQQVVYVVDAYWGQVEDHSLLQYSVFVVFFPQLIAGPIVHHRDVLPQFLRQERNVTAPNLSIGLVLLTVGLFKKVILADNLSLYAVPVFNAAEQGLTLTALEAWMGVMSYTFQLYFDFSGYSDMALGLGRMFGITLPLNFNSPYKSVSMHDMLHRWHITLTRFFTDYVHLPLAYGVRMKHHVAIMVTMFLSGLWHGAAWNFVLFGCLLGAYLVVNHTWTMFFRVRTRRSEPSHLGRFSSQTVTFLAWVFSMVLFRAESLSAAKALYGAMIGLNGAALPIQLASWLDRVPFLGGVSLLRWDVSPYFEFSALPWLLGSGCIVWLVPNAYELLAKFHPAIGFKTSRPALSEAFFGWCNRYPALLGTALGILAGLSILGLNQKSEFLYFQF